MLERRVAEELERLLGRFVHPDAANPAEAAAELVRLRLRAHAFRGSDLEQLLEG